MRERGHLRLYTQISKPYKSYKTSAIFSKSSVFSASASCPLILLGLIKVNATFYNLDLRGAWRSAFWTQLEMYKPSVYSSSILIAVRYEKLAKAHEANLPSANARLKSSGGEYIVWKPGCLAANMAWSCLQNSRRNHGRDLRV
jgi:hypothetical protein